VEAFGLRLIGLSVLLLPRNKPESVYHQLYIHVWGGTLGILELIPSDVRLLFVKVFLGVIVIYVVLRSIGFHTLFLSDTEGISALLLLIGTLYSVLYAFATYVIWGQFTAVENEILKESGALKDLLVFSRPLPERVRDPIVRSVKNYAKAVVESEWELLSQNAETEKTDRMFLEIVSSVTDAKPEDETQRTVFERLLEIANQASSHRDERLALSVKRMPRTLHFFVSLTAVMILLLVLCYPFRDAVLGMASTVITSMLLFFARFVLTDLDNPFEGSWNASNAPFADLAIKFR
jgi:hypothetical protein